MGCLNAYPVPSWDRLLRRAGWAGICADGAALPESPATQSAQAPRWALGVVWASSAAPRLHRAPGQHCNTCIPPFLSLCSHSCTKPDPQPVYFNTQTSPATARARPTGQVQTQRAAITFSSLLTQMAREARSRVLAHTPERAAQSRSRWLPCCYECLGAAKWVYILRL